MYIYVLLVNWLSIVLSLSSGDFSEVVGSSSCILSSALLSASSWSSSVSLVSSNILEGYDGDYGDEDKLSFG